jgi:hypothetical protein
MTGALSGGSKAPGVVEGDVRVAGLIPRVATTARCARCDGSLLSPLHLAIKRNGFQMMFPPAAT